VNGDVRPKQGTARLPVVELPTDAKAVDGPFALYVTVSAIGPLGTEKVSLISVPLFSPPLQV